MVHIFRKSLLWTAILYIGFVLITMLIGMIRTYLYQPEVGYTAYVPEESAISNVVEFGSTNSNWLVVSLFVIIFILQLIRFKRKNQM